MKLGILLSLAIIFPFTTSIIAETQDDKKKHYCDNAFVVDSLQEFQQELQDCLSKIRNKDDEQKCIRKYTDDYTKFTIKISEECG